MLAFMGAGKLIGRQISAAIINDSSSGLAKFMGLVKPKQFSPAFITSQTTKGISKNISNSFFKRFNNELVQET